MPLSYVTYKLVRLLVLCTAQRAQTLHSINIEKLVSIPITKLLKQPNAKNQKFKLYIKPYNFDTSCVQGKHYIDKKN